MEFVCKVGTPSGDVVEERFSATDEAALRAELEQRGYYLFAIRRGLGFEGLRLGAPRIPNDMLLIFGQEMAALLKAGLPLLQCLDVTLERQKHAAFRRSLTAVRERVKSGQALSDAFRAEGALYPPILAASLVAGERSGALEDVLRRFASYLRLTQSMKKKAVSAAVYPMVLVGMMLVLVFILVVKVIPQFQDFYKDFEVELPLVTRVLMGTASVISAHFVWLLLLAVAGVLGFVFWLRRPGRQATLDRLMLRIPYVGHLMRMYATSQLARTLSSLLTGGLPLVYAMEVSAASVGNKAVAQAVTSATPLVREGKSLTTALEATGVVENLTLEMVKVGEQTGALGDMLSAVADFYDEEMGNRLATVMALVEPVLLVVMAVVVAGMLLAFYLPLFQAISAIQAR